MLICLILLGFLTLGCAHGPLARRDPLPTQTPTTAQLVTHLNQQAVAVQSLEYDTVHIQAKHGVQSIGVTGMLAYQKPRNFRLQAYAATQTQADVGSNDQEFWFWFKQNDPPDLYRCSYDDLPKLQNLRIPIHPEWIAEALCVQDLGAAEHYKMRTVGQSIELTSQTKSPQGQPLLRTTTVALSGPNHGRITGLKLRTVQGQEVWSADVLEYQQKGGYTVPRKVTVRCPAEKMEMQFKLDGPKVNTIVAGRNPLLFKRPDGYREVDLARGPITTPASIERVRGSGLD